MRESAPEVSVVTITYNEAENIGRFVEAVAAALGPLGVSYEIVVVDDDSPDGTAEVVRRLAARHPVRLVVRTNERGIGSAYLRGVRESRGAIVALLDADLSHPPDRLPVMLPHARGGALVIGSRFLRRGDFETLWYRRFVTRGINRWHRYFLRTGLHDHTNGYLVVRREILDRLVAEGERRGIPPFTRILYTLPLVVFATRAGIPVREVPAPYRFRTKGETKIRFFSGVRLLFDEWLDSIRLFGCK